MKWLTKVVLLVRGSNHDPDMLILGQYFCVKPNFPSVSSVFCSPQDRKTPPLWGWVFMHKQEQSKNLASFLAQVNFKQIDICQ